MDGMTLPMDDHAKFILAKKSELKRVVSELKDSQAHMTKMAQAAYDIVSPPDSVREIARAIRPK